MTIEVITAVGSSRVAVPGGHQRGGERRWQPC